MRDQLIGPNGSEKITLPLGIEGSLPMDSGRLYREISSSWVALAPGSLRT
jgi:ABC-type polysaccharide/polyol phosphate transport system ATPase subunit